MTIDEWHNRLAETFTVHGIVGGHLIGVHKREQSIRHHLVTTFRGQNALIDSFQSFYVESLDLAMKTVASSGWPKPPSSYPSALAHFHTLFRRYRACENLFYAGYPLDGYSLLRDVKDRAFMLAGVAHNMTTLDRMIGMITPIEDTVEWRKKSTRLRKDEEFKISRRMYGQDSGLNADVVNALKSWDDLFHYEVHGARFSVAYEVQQLAAGHPNPPGPTIHKDAFTLYMNRIAEVAWLILRLLPYLQKSENAFGDEWHRKYAVLDDSFRFVVQSLTIQLGKKIGDAFVLLVDQKFTFEPMFHYFDADGSVL